MDIQNTQFKEFFKKIGLSINDMEKREACLQNFIKDGFPSKKIEDWRFLDLNKIISLQIPNLKFFNQEILENIEYKNLIDRLNVQIENLNYIIFFNGFIKEIDFKKEDITKIQCIRKNAISVSKSNSSLTNLNNALSYDYIKLIISKNYTFKKPLILINITNDRITNTNFSNSIDIDIGENSNLSILDINLNKSKNNFFNSKKNYKLNCGSILKNYVLDPFQNENLNYSYTNIDLEKNSVSENFILSKGSKFSKNEISCNLNDEYSSAFINGVIDICHNEKHEIRSKIRHLSPNTKSYQLIKSALKDEAKAVYQGKIYVDSVAQKTDGYQLSKAILLDKETEFNAKPELEIYADDVKCSHGSSSGNLDENKIFYLMTRGLDKVEAKKILLEGYFLEVIEKITDLEAKKIVKNLTDVKNEH